MLEKCELPLCKQIFNLRGSCTHLDFSFLTMTPSEADSALTVVAGSGALEKQSISKYLN